MIQTLIANGHPWEVIQNYSLSEIAFFYGAACQLEDKRYKRQTVSHWVGHNALREEMLRMTQG
ncbi:MAG: hypothetical protein HQL52_20150 [Magnetococcales bacterium]|nr:hypothetical protein [Magnetococcales bacterium]